MGHHGNGHSSTPTRIDEYKNHSTEHTAVPLAQELLDRCKDLLKELDEFREHLKSRSKENTVELRQFRNAVHSELKSLEKLTKADPTADRTQHTIRSSNLPFYSTVWTTARRCTGLVAFSKRFYWETPQRTKTKSWPNNSRLHGEAPSQHDEKPSDQKEPIANAYTSNRCKDKKSSALVDIVAGNGEEWIKVSTITETRVVFEMAEAGWNCDDSNSDDEAGSRNDDDNEDGGLSLLRLAEDLTRAAKAVRVRYKHPKIRFVLPKLVEGRVSQIDRLLNNIRRTGVFVQCAGDLEGIPTPPLADVLDDLVVDDFASFTDVINIDCTILLALVSDLSHGRVAVEPWFHRAIRRQIELEEEEKLLPTFLFPAMGHRKLVCTAEAAKRMREIVDLIGTPAEKARTVLLMGEGTLEANHANGADEGVDEATQRHDLIREFRRWSAYEIPDEWHLPIKTVDGQIDMKALPPTASAVSDSLTAINQSVFLYGWATSRTTISSNRTVAKLIETVIEGNRTGEEEVGPDVWLCPTARSLVGKEKNRKN